MREGDDHRITHHVELPSGRRIEVVYLDGARESAEPPRTVAPPTPDGALHRTAAPPTPDEALHVCPRCAGGLVHPLDWLEESSGRESSGQESSGRWRILLRCPDCGLERHGVFATALVERFDDELDRAAGALLGDLKRLTHANMAAEIDLFVRALELDLIGPSDF